MVSKFEERIIKEQSHLLKEREETKMPKIRDKKWEIETEERRVEK
jgi:hypothetical protein